MSWIGALPKRVIVGMISEANLNNYEKNPFYFEHFNFSSIQLSSDCFQELLPIKTNFSKNQYMQAYLSLFGASGNTLIFLIFI